MSTDHHQSEEAPDVRFSDRLADEGRTVLHDQFLHLQLLDVGVTREAGSAIARAGIGLGSMQIKTVRLINSLNSADLESSTCEIVNAGDCGVDLP